ncbi:MAG: hypothetical protein LBG19_08845 [Prevotellaceae bacterium]|jgi:hydrogenase-4 component E|nr:hypothetical protein [Prevotellaceae bacterium]
MIALLILLFAVSLIFFSITERFRTYAMLIGLQGVLLFGISFSLLREINTLNLIFIVVETLVFKALIVPWLLYRIIKRTKTARVHKGALPAFYSILLVILAMLVSVVLTSVLKDAKVDSFFLAISIFALLTGMILITTHKRIFSHMVGFLVIENAVFLFSIAAGAEMPMLINTAILLDIFISVLILGVFMTKIEDRMHSLETDMLTKLKD